MELMDASAVEKDLKVLLKLDFQSFGSATVSILTQMKIQKCHMSRFRKLDGFIRKWG